MKTILTTILAILFSGVVLGQTKKYEKPRYLKYSTMLCPIDIEKSYDEKGLFGANTATIQLKPKIIKEKMKVLSSGETVELEKIVQDTILIKTIMIEEGYAFDVVQQIGSYSIIKFWELKESTAKNLFSKLKDNSSINANLSNLKTMRFTEESNDLSTMKVKGLVAQKQNDTIGYDLSQTYFVVPTKTMENNSTEFDNKSGQWNIGLLAMPIKIRPFATESGQFDFLSGYSIGTTFSWTVHHNWKTNFTHNLLVYAGVSSYKADENKIKEKREDYTMTTFSPAIGWLWEKNNIQLGVLAGIDFPAGELQKKWVYRNMPWFGIGVGIALFKLNKDEQNEQGKN